MRPPPLISALAVACSLSAALPAQYATTFHTTLRTDSVRSIRIDLSGELSYETWDGNTVLAQSTVQLSNASASLRDYLVDQEGRYNVEGSVRDSVLYVSDQQRDRNPIGGEVEELVRIHLMLPKSFVQVGPDRFERDGRGGVGAPVRTAPSEATPSGASDPSRWRAPLRRELADSAQVPEFFTGFPDPLRRLRRRSGVE